jgi:serine phosphatase RsbU (regulator of sigma subunit)
MYFSIEWYKNNIATLPDKTDRQEKTIIFLTSASDYLVEESFLLAKQLHAEALETDNTSLLAFSLLYMGFYQRMHGQKELADAGAKEAERLAMIAEPALTTGIVCQMLAFEYWGSGQRDKAFEMAYYGLKLADKMNQAKEGFGWAQFQLGVFHFDMKDYNVSLQHFLSSEKTAEELDLNYQLARIRSGIGSIHIATGNLEDGLKYNRLALDGYRDCGHKTAVSRALNDLGVIHFRIGKVEEAENYLREALTIRENLSYAPGVITTRMELSKVLMNRENNSETEHLLLTALELSKETNSKQKASQCHLLLSEFYKLKEKPWQALEHLEEHFKVKSAVAGEEAINRINSMQQKFATEKSESEAEIHRLKNVELKKAYSEIEEKNKSILDSIHYAKRIQGALLASDELLNKSIPDHFILYKPKDIVSGDFYWAYKGKDLFFLAVCDCTGHGVPGAFMSLLNSTYLNEAVIEKELTDPAEILNEVRKQLIAALNPEGSKEETRDGMDATLIAFNEKTKTLSFASANNPFVLIHKGELRSFSPDKFPVGIYPGYEKKPFTTHALNMQQGDCIYLLTDGYGDQFGGPAGKKFKLRKLKEYLQEIHHLPMNQQHKKLETQHEAWKGQLEQVDDILVAGIRF